MQKITPFLWFDNNAEEAMDFYTSIFRDSKTVKVDRIGDGTPGPRGAIVVATFVINGQEIMALNGGPHFKFTPAFSLHVACETQAEVDELWDKLGRRRRAQPVRLAHRQVRIVVADRAYDSESTHSGQRSRQVRSRPRGDARYGQNRHRGIAESSRRTLKLRSRSYGRP